MLVVIGTACIGSFKSNYHTITTTTAPTIINIFTCRNTSLHVTTNESDSHQNESQYDETDSISYQSVTWRHYTLDDSVSVHHSSTSDDKTVHHSTASDDKTVDHTLHSYEDVQDMEDEHHYLQIITPEEDATCTKDNISWNLHFNGRCARLTPEEDAKHNTSWTLHFNVRCVQYAY
jgi:hypothetical protein